jgi:hypothetical protein
MIESLEYDGRSSSIIESNESLHLTRRYESSEGTLSAGDAVIEVSGTQ